MTRDQALALIDVAGGVRIPAVYLAGAIVLMDARGTVERVHRDKATVRVGRMAHRLALDALEPSQAGPRTAA